jgi:tetratricopeptide (TPR) repeat protein
MEYQEPIEHSEIIKRYEDILKKTPHSYLFVPLANAYIEKGEPEKAIAVAQEGLLAHPDYISAKMVLAKAFYDCQRIADAKKESLEVLQAKPDNLLAHKILIDIYMSENDQKKAGELIERLKELSPGDTNMELLISSLEIKLNQASSEKAPKEEFGEKEQPDSNDLNTETLAKIYEDQELYDKALETYQKILDKRPDDESIQKKIEELKSKKAKEQSGAKEKEPEKDIEEEEILKDVIEDKESIQEIHQLFLSKETGGEEEPSSPEDSKKVINTLENWMKNIESKKDE